MKKKKEIRKIELVLFLLLMLAAGFVFSTIFTPAETPTGHEVIGGQSVITRSFNPDPVYGGRTVAVTLDTTLVSNDDFFTIVETIPSGFVVNPASISDGGILQASGSEIRWLKYNAPLPTSVNYIITAPSVSITTDYSFSGTFTTETVRTPTLVGGDTALTVNPCSSTGTLETICNGIDDDCDYSIDEDYVQTPTTCGQDICASTGIKTCTSGIEQDSCAPGIPTAEACGNGDENCDGVTDENPLTICTGQGNTEPNDGFTCQSGACICASLFEEDNPNLAWTPSRWPTPANCNNCINLWEPVSYADEWLNGNAIVTQIEITDSLFNWLNGINTCLV